MARLNLMIADADEAYIAQLAGYIQNHHSGRLCVSCVSSEKHLKSHLQNGAVRYDILLATSSIAASLGCGSDTLLLQLSDGRVTRNELPVPMVEKYQRADQIVAKIIQYYMQARPEQRFVSLHSGSVRLVGIFSPSGGCGKSVIAAGLSAIAQSYGMTAMYLNLEGCDASGGYFPEITGCSVSELLYHIKEGAAQLSLKLEALSWKDPRSGVRYFGPAETLIDFNGMDDGEVETLTRELKRMSDVEVVFLDLSSNVDPVNLKVLESVDKILLISGDDRISERKVRRFSEQLPVVERIRNVDYSGKMILVKNKRSGIGNWDNEDSGVIRTAVIENDGKLTAGESICDSLTGEFGVGLKTVWSMLEIG